jgi:glycosyltransferase involved in cell wall biosynthesis
MELLTQHLLRVLVLVVQDILAHPEQVARVRANALALVKEKYDWNLIATQMRALFATLGI